MELETGDAVTTQVESHGEIRAVDLHAVLDATVVHTGHPDTLVTATRDLLDWADQRGLDWDTDGRTWGCRLEEYLSDPAEVPDMGQWETRLAFRLRD
jgi:effector-binding domain-containing protein